MFRRAQQRSPQLPAARLGNIRNGDLDRAIGYTIVSKKTTVAQRVAQHDCCP
jgi:hypothetical protein